MVYAALLWSYLFCAGCSSQKVLCSFVFLVHQGAIEICLKLTSFDVQNCALLCTWCTRCTKILMSTLGIFRVHTDTSNMTKYFWCALCMHYIFLKWYNVYSGEHCEPMITNIFFGVCCIVMVLLILCRVLITKSFVFLSVSGAPGCYINLFEINLFWCAKLCTLVYMVHKVHKIFDEHSRDFLCAHWYIKHDKMFWNVHKIFIKYFLNNILCTLGNTVDLW